MLLDVKNLTVGYRTDDRQFRIAVDGVSLALDKGETLGIAGESGCGKTTLARALMAYTRPGSKIVGGNVFLDGTDILALPDRQKHAIRGSRIAMVPQNPLSSLTFHMRVGAQIDEIVCRHEGLSRRQAQEKSVALLAATGMPEPDAIYRRYPHELSGGQRQRVVIAAALACRPGILVLDEPTTALDKTTELRVLELVSQLREQFDTALVYISHDLNVIARVCDRICVMRDGRVIEAGDTRKTFASPVHGYTRRLLDAIPRVNASGPVRPLRADSGEAPILEVTNLKYRYPATGLGIPFSPKKPGTLAVQDLSFSINRGRTLGLVGESGSGKSTVASVISGIIPPGSGKIAFDGVPLNRAAPERPADLRRRIQMVFQDPLSSLNPRLSIGRILMRPLRVFFAMGHEEARQEAARLLERMDMRAELLDRFPRQLSGGQQQRVALARAFAARPDLIICDEVTSALDVSVQASVLDLLLSMQAESGVSCLFISHDLGVIKRVADDVIVLQSGEVRDAGPTSDVFTAPSHPYTQLLLEATRNVFDVRPAASDEAALAVQ
ncbi:dipeptide ABC transporter ATP-binding protein [Shinella granuli]|uniref:Peptide/nickel transport system ATP-binding protein n=1 Tax=Shinella granuli TaxID=323621 RepID=A0A4R2C754_SHIGR|nr:ABC transporter ATP-binding protein [Shinella granuli]TCN35633.1 peptide/nickel transport system ATP-binding protein [Shinella granuli]